MASMTNRQQLQVLRTQYFENGSGDSESDSETDSGEVEPVMPQEHEWFMLTHAEMEYWMALKNPEKIPHGFLTAKEGVPWVANSISAGDQILCCAPAVYSPSDLFLGVGDDLSSNIEMIWEMTDAYRALDKDENGYSWIAHPEALQPGMFVAVYNREEKYWLRGRVIRQTTFGERKHFMIHHIDIGDMVEYCCGEIAYLLEEFARKRPCYAIRCRLQLSSYYDRYHSRLEKWKKHVREYLFHMLRKRTFYAKFVRQTSQLHDGEVVWEVSLEKFEVPHPTLFGGRSIQEEIIQNTMGKYIDDWE